MGTIKKYLLVFIKSELLQPLWEKIHRYSIIGMNFWGGASLLESGEKYALQYAKSKIKKESLVILFDVGANYGQYATLASKIFENNTLIYSFEPSKPTFNALNKIVSDTGLVDKIKTFNIGMGEQVKKLILHSSGQGDSKASLYNLQKPEITINAPLEEEVTISTIDVFCKEKKLDEIYYLKLDIEGHEFYVLKGAKEMIENRKIKFIQFEFSECNIVSRTFFKDFYNYLSPFYNLFRIVSNGLRPVKTYSTDMEIFCIANFLAERKD